MLATEENTGAHIPYFGNPHGRKTEISSYYFLNACPVSRCACEWTHALLDATYHTVQCYLNDEDYSFFSPWYEVIYQDCRGKCVSSVPCFIDKPPDSDCCETQSWHKTVGSGAQVLAPSSSGGLENAFQELDCSHMQQYSMCGFHLTCWCWPLTVFYLGHFIIFYLN